MEQLDLAEADGSEQIQLIGDGAGGVLGEDPFIQLFAKRFPAGSCQIFAVSPPMNGLKFGERAFDNIENPKRTAGSEGIMQRLKDRLPLVIGPQVVQHGRGNDHVKSSGAFNSRPRLIISDLRKLITGVTISIFVSGFVPTSITC